MLVMKRPHREEISAGEAVSIFVLASIPIFGVFYYKYYNYQYSFMFIMAATTYFISKYKISL
jgi:uncharacterized membrane protein